MRIMTILRCNYIILGQFQYERLSMKKKLFSLILIITVGMLLAACGDRAYITVGTGHEISASGESGTGVVLNVCTTFAGEDGNAQNFKNAVNAWCRETGNTVADSSQTSDETFKTRVITDFETGSEPDVLFFFNGADANNFIEAGLVVSIDEIREEYPSFATNMNDDLIAESIVDGRKYAVPVNGFWEGLFVNTDVLKAVGLTVPGPNYTMNQFKEDCKRIKAAGYTPIAASLGTIPHYWWEFAIFNHDTPASHLSVPEINDCNNWVEGMKDIKELYDLGFFPANTLSATDDETFEMFINSKAAFMIDGSWKVGSIVAACQTDPEDITTLDEDMLKKFTVAYVPGSNTRKASDLIGGLSMGYYISRYAWENEAKRDAAVSFVSYMTSDNIVTTFAAHTATALKAAPEVDAHKYNSLQIKAMSMMRGATSITGAVQDIFNGDCRISTFDKMPEIVTGAVTAEEAVKKGLTAYHAQ